MDIRRFFGASSQGSPATKEKDQGASKPPSKKRKTPEGDGAAAQSSSQPIGAATRSAAGSQPARVSGRASQPAAVAATSATIAIDLDAEDDVVVEKKVAVELPNKRSKHSDDDDGSSSNNNSSHKVSSHPPHPHHPGTISAAVKSESVTTATALSSPPKQHQQQEADAASETNKHRGNAAAYRAYLSRPPPPKQGQKELPRGPRDCLRGKDFIITGVLDSLTREDAQHLIESHGGTVAKSVTKRVTHALIGTEAGPSKLAKIQEKNIPILSEDDLLEMIRAAGERPTDSTPVPLPISSPSTTPTKAATTAMSHTADVGMSGSRATPISAPRVIPSSPTAIAGTPPQQQHEQYRSTPTAEPQQLWTDKYAPKVSSQVIGNGGVVQQLKEWLQTWAARHLHSSSGSGGGRESHADDDDDEAATDGKGGGGKAKAKAKKDKAASSLPPRAALLTGPPGLGKTTAATLVSAECNYNAINLNASDTRSKTSLRETVTEMLRTHGLTEYWSASNSNSNNRKRTVLIMDEVDGMSSGDRGGLAELIQLIKDTKVPIICIANDRYKVRSLESHCMKLPFRRPTAQQLLARLTQIAHIEKLMPAIDPLVLRRLAESAHGDVRHAVHVLQYWSAGAGDGGGGAAGATPTSVTTSSIGPSVDTVREELQRGGKNITLGPFDAAPQLLSVNAGTRMTNQLEAFFIDHSLVPLFIFENYLNMNPALPPAVSSRPPPGQQAAIAQRIALASDSISLGDILSQSIRKDQNWELLPGMGVVSSVRPAMCASGQLRGQLQFPQWLGRNSSSQKRARLAGELQLQMTLATSGATSRSLRLDYAGALSQALTQPLVLLGPDGIEPIIETMDSYGITREGREGLFELIALSGTTSPLDAVSPTLKSAFTRTYKKVSHKVTSAVPSMGRGRKAGGGRKGGSAPPPGGAVVGPDGELAMVGSDDENESAALGGDPDGGGDDNDNDGDAAQDDSADALLITVPSKSKARSAPSSASSKKAKGATPLKRTASSSTSKAKRTSSSM